MEDSKKETAASGQQDEAVLAEQRRSRSLKIRSLAIVSAVFLAASVAVVVHNNIADRNRADKMDMAAYAAQSLIEAKQNAAAQEDRQQIADNLAALAQSSAPVTSSEHMAIVQDKSLMEVSEPPKTMTQILQEMAGSKKDEPTVRLNEKEMTAPLTSPSEGIEQPVKLGAASLGKTKNITVADHTVETRVFQDPDSYHEFTSSRPGPYPAIDFNTQYAVMLVSNSEVPSKALEIVDVSVLKDRISVKFRVNTSKIGDGGPERYPVAPFIRSNLPVVSEQVQ